LTGFLVEGGDPDQVEGVESVLIGALMALGLPLEGLGWTRFFLLCTVLAVPGMLLLIWVAPWGGHDKAPDDTSGAPEDASGPPSIVAE
jgi:PAT family beta-lactamase induction signal transducer AmpG